MFGVLDLKISKISSWILLISLIAFIFSYFLKQNYKYVFTIDKSVTSQPIQTQIEDQNPIKFKFEGSEFVLKPKFNYELSGILVHRMRYNVWYSLSKADNVIPIDFCMIWGKNASSGVFRDRSVKFSQDMRWCNYRAGTGVEMNYNEISNNHLVVNDAQILKKLESFSPGDQIKITGKLVDVKAKLLEKEGDTQNISLTTSTIRNDSGAGACEIIYVEKVELLKAAHPILGDIYRYSLYIFLGAFAFKILWVIVRIIHFKVT